MIQKGCTFKDKYTIRQIGRKTYYHTITIENRFDRHKIKKFVLLIRTIYRKNVKELLLKLS